MLHFPSGHRWIYLERINFMLKSFQFVMDYCNFTALLFSSVSIWTNGKKLFEFVNLYVLLFKLYSAKFRYVSVYISNVWVMSCVFDFICVYTNRCTHLHLISFLHCTSRMMLKCLSGKIIYHYKYVLLNVSWMYRVVILL